MALGPDTGERAELPARLRLRPLEELWAIPVGIDEATASLDARPAQSLREALEQAVLPALRRPPCLVSFSGGVDSSLVLAIATHVARREGLAPPVPVTNRFPEVAEADEADWQERVVGHLALGDWLRLEWTDELDVLGPVATRVLARHGLLAPFNAHFHVPLLERAAGGSLLTGVGGDELFARVARTTAADVLLGPRRPRVGELPALAFGLAPRRLRAAAIARRRPFGAYAWIRPEARARLARAYAAWESAEPLRHDRSLREWWWRSRMLQCNLAGKRLLAADAGAAIESPLAAPAVIAACAREGGRAGAGSRPAALARLAGDLLPESVLRRTTKASFDGAFWSRHARAFAAEWDGGGVDDDAVDVAALREEWASQRADPHSFSVCQRAWLMSAR